MNRMHSHTLEMHLASAKNAVMGCEKRSVQMQELGTQTRENALLPDKRATRHLVAGMFKLAESMEGEGSLNFVCTGVCGYITGKLTDSQTKAGASINKNRPIPRAYIKLL